METLKHYLEIEIINLGNYHVKIFTILTVFLILMITRLLIWVIKKSLFRKQTFQGLDRGNVYAIFQIIKYLIWVIAIGITMETIGIKVTVLIAGSAALLVGIGLGLQQTFNDIVSGIILLSERTIKVDDILEIDGDIIKIQTIGLRTSKGLSRDDISIIIPNSLITTNKVINWSHQNRKTRFKISVGVAYGSDIDLVEKVLVESVLAHPEISEKNHVEARFINFNNSSLDFQVLFFSEEVFRIEKIKSDIRKIINRKFIENGVKIPFPQMDLHLMSNHTNTDLL